MVDHAERAKRSTKTIEFLETKGRHLVRILGASKRCSKLTLGDTTDYMHKRLDEGASKHTIQKEIRVLTQALRRAAKLGKYRAVLDPRALKPDELEGAYVPRERWLTHEEFAMLLAEFDPARTPHQRSEDRRDYLVMYVATGVRDSELYGIEARHVDLANNMLHIAGTKTKGARRSIPMMPAARAVLERRMEARKQGPLFPRWGKVQRDLDLACLRIEGRLNPGWKRPQGRAAHSGKANGHEGAPRRNAKGQPPPKRDRVRPPVRFDTVSPNDLRRTFASWLAQRGVPLLTASQLMGHSTTKMLETVYARLGPQTMRDAIALLPDVSPAVTRAVTANRDEAEPSEAT